MRALVAHPTPQDLLNTVPNLSDVGGVIGSLDVGVLVADGRLSLQLTSVVSLSKAHEV